VTAIAPTTPHVPTQGEQVKTAAKQLEAFFLRQLLAEARPPGGGGIDGGFAGDTFKQMLDEALADKMSGAGGIGMAKLFEKQLANPVDEKPPIASPLPHAQPPMATPPIGTPPAPPIGEMLPGPHFAMPVIGRATSGYGERVDPIHHTTGMHPGQDLAAPTGTRVGAAAAGEVVHAGPAGTYGNLVTIRHDDGFETRYAHLSAVHVKPGDRVEVGQDVGAVGTTGHSTGPHLHFEIRKEGQALDPIPYLSLHRPTNRATR